MQHREEQTQSVRWLLASRCQGVISTHSLEHPGYPFGSVVPYVLNNSGMPLMLLSHLSQHTKNLEANAQCGLTVAETGTGDIQQLGRLSAIGDVDKVDGAQDAERYFRYFPQSRMYHDELGFKFYRFVPRRFHWNGGFATASWFGTDRIVRANPLTADEEAGIVAHMNGDHADAVLHYWRRCRGRSTRPVRREPCSSTWPSPQPTDLQLKTRQVSRGQAATHSTATPESNQR